MSTSHLQSEDPVLTASVLSEKLQEQIPRILSANAGEPHHDPIIQDLMKMNPRPAKDDSEVSEEPFETSISTYSFQLAEILDLLLEQKIDDAARIEYEVSLTDHTSVVPVLLAAPDSRKYPDDYLSRVLIDNYLHLLKLANLYFNFSLASHVTKFLVKLIYKLECWEIYHLLQILPDLEYFLKLVDIDVSTTPFGHIVKPPENLMSFNLRQGFQYPFPYPFYNFSFHTPDPYATSRKYAKIAVDNYIDIRLKKSTKKRKRPRSWPKLPDFHDEEVEIKPGVDTTLQLPPVLKSQGSGKFSSDVDYQRHQKVYIFMEMSLRQIDHEVDVFYPEGNVEDDDYDTDEADAIMAEENEGVDFSRLPEEKYIVVPSVFERVLQDAEQKGIAKLTTLHQCRLLDPSNMRPCLKIFYGKNELQRHQEFVHATTKKIYKCAYCESSGSKPQSYPRHDSLARHIRRKHGIIGRENKIAINLAKKNAVVVDDNAPSATPPFSYPVMYDIPGTSGSPGAAAARITQTVRGVAPLPLQAQETPAGSNSAVLDAKTSGSKTSSPNKVSDLLTSAPPAAAASSSKSPKYIQHPPTLAGLHPGFPFDSKDIAHAQSPQDVSRGGGVYMYPYGGSSQQGPLPMHGASTYGLPQYSKFGQWPIPQTMAREEESKPGDVRQSPQASMAHGFQKFRFPNNYYQMPPAYPIYGQEAMYYPVQLMAGQMPYISYAQPPQHQAHSLHEQNEIVRRQQQQQQQQQQQLQTQPQDSPQQRDQRASTQQSSGN